MFYLTDSSTQEKYEFVRCLSLYDFTPTEISCATRSMSKPLHLYMQDFVFDAVNTKLPESDSSFRGDLTTYIRDYKLQKLTNRIFPEFLKRVNAYAQSPRPYNKLQPRSSIISHMDTVIPRDVWENCSAALLKAEENWGIVELGYQFPESDRDAGKIKLVSFQDFVMSFRSGYQRSSRRA